jgi:MFS family permease
MLKTLSNNWPLFFGILLIMIANGLQGTLLGVRAGIEGFSTFTIGILMSFYYLGFLGGYFFVPKLVLRVGHIRVFAALASLASAAVLLHGLFPVPFLWLLARAVTGFCYAGLYIVIESWLNQAADNKSRGSILALYLLASHGGMMLGQFLLNITDPAQLELFVLTSIIVSLALLPISLSQRPAPIMDKPDPISLKALYKTSPLGVVGMFFNGFGSGAIYGLAAVFAAMVGMSIPQISLFMASFIIGGIALTIPVGWLSDHISRSFVMVSVSILISISASICFFVGTTDFPLLLLATTLMGGLCFSTYGLSIAYTNDRLKPNQMLSASSSMILVNGVGACFGPVLVSLIMSQFGPSSFFPAIAIIFLGIALFGLYRVKVGKKVTLENQTDSFLVPVRTSSVLMRLIKQEIE